jgi:hypothetical protein
MKGDKSLQNDGTYLQNHMCHILDGSSSMFSFSEATFLKKKCKEQVTRIIQ